MSKMSLFLVQILKFALFIGPFRIKTTLFPKLVGIADVHERLWNCLHFTDFY